MSPLRRRRLPEVPGSLRLYVIGDIHGCATLLGRLLQRIYADIAEDNPSDVRFVFLGDYVDRGPESRDVIDMLLKLSDRTSVCFLKGNHEQVLLDFLAEPLRFPDWSQYGATTTLMSYGIRPSLRPSAAEISVLAASFAAVMPPTHHAFFNSLMPSWSCGDYFFAHAGVRPGVPLAAQTEADLLWIREEFLTYEAEFEKVVVHGHTPVMQAEVRRNRINIDTGAFATGVLTCLRLQGNTQTFLSS